MTARAVSGVGLGFRVQIAEAMLALPEGALDFVEVHPENYVGHGGRFASMLERACAKWPVLSHGLTGGFCAPTRHDAAYLRAIGDFVERVRAPFHSDHLCLGASGSVFLHDLLPIPFDAATRAIAVDRIREARDVVGRPIAIEHLSYYVPMSSDPLDEARFLADVLEETDASLLLDVNNIVVNAKNHRFDPHDWLALVPLERTVEIHVAGHLLRRDGLTIDTHGEAVCADVFALLERALARTGDVPILLERDENLTSFEDVRGDLTALRAIRTRVFDLRDEGPYA